MDKQKLIAEMADAIASAGHIPWIDKRDEEQVRLEQAQAAYAVVEKYLQPADVQALVEALQGILRGAESVLLDAMLNETDISIGVLQSIRNDAKSALIPFTPKEQV
jgi:hypothetical protein